MIQRNRAPYGRWGNFIFGLAAVLDGLIRVLSLGYCHGNHRWTPLNVSRELTRKHLNRSKS